jgi:hypothetical protein
MTKKALSGCGGGLKMLLLLLFKLVAETQTQLGSQQAHMK